MDPSLRLLLQRIDRLSDEFRELREGVHKAVAVADLDPDMALTRARKVLEYIVRDVFERRVKEPAGTRPLENLLQQLVKDGHMPPRLEAYASTIRILGNVGTHRFGENVSAADVHQSLAQLMPILEWYFEVERPDAGPARPGPTASPQPPARQASDGPLDPPPPSKPSNPSPRSAGRKKLWLTCWILLALLLVVGGGVVAFIQWNRTHGEGQPNPGPPPPQPTHSLTLAQTDRYVGKDSEGKPIWEWTVRVVGDPADLAAVRQVTYHLHPTFEKNPNPVVTGPNEGPNAFALTRSGWGRFDVKATVLFTDDSTLELDIPLQFTDPIKD